MPAPDAHLSYSTLKSILCYTGICLLASVIEAAIVQLRWKYGLLLLSFFTSTFKFVGWSNLVILVAFAFFPMAKTSEFSWIQMP